LQALRIFCPNRFTRLAEVDEIELRFWHLKCSRLQWQRMGVLSMDVNQLRAAYIKSHLRRALANPKGSLAARVAVEFSRYAEWFADALPKKDKSTITGMLSRLKRTLGGRSPRRNQV
jgi:hypothetical protein